MYIDLGWKLIPFSVTVLAFVVAYTQTTPYTKSGSFSGISNAIEAGFNLAIYSFATIVSLVAWLGWAVW